LVGTFLRNNADEHARSNMRRCHHQNTVVGSIASHVYIPSLRALAESAFPFGFRCVVTQPFDAAHAAELLSSATNLRVHALPVPVPPLLPRQRFCRAPEDAYYGWRRTHLHKVSDRLLSHGPCTLRCTSVTLVSPPALHCVSLLTDSPVLHQCILFSPPALYCVCSCSSMLFSL
jgi:hypothetical protein